MPRHDACRVDPAEQIVCLERTNRADRMPIAALLIMSDVAGNWLIIILSAATTDVRPNAD